VVLPGMAVNSALHAMACINRCYDRR